MTRVLKKQSGLEGGFESVVLRSIRRGGIDIIILVTALFTKYESTGHGRI